MLPPGDPSAHDGLLGYTHPFDPEIASSNPDRGTHFFISPFRLSATFGSQWISYFGGLEMVHDDHISVLPLFCSMYRAHLIDAWLKRKLP